MTSGLIETNREEDYSDGQQRTLESSGGPIILSPDAQHSIKGFEPIYVSPELEDILDRKSHDVYHEEVHGTVLMPRLSFSKNDDDQPIREADLELVPGVDPRPIRKGSGCGKSGCQGVSVHPNPLYNPTIEEMIPFAKIRESKDTFIVMADDPVCEFFKGAFII